MDEQRTFAETLGEKELASYGRGDGQLRESTKKLLGHTGRILERQKRELILAT